MNEHKGDFFIHTHALVEEGAVIGEGTRIWAFAHVLPGAVIGDDCNICDHTFIEGDVRLGNRVTVKCGVYLWDGITAEDDVFIGPAACFTNDLKPRSKQDFELLQTVLKRGCSIGANAAIVGGVVIGAWAMVGLGSVVTKDVPDYAVVFGNPARFQYWMCRCTRKMYFNQFGEFACECGDTYRLNAETQRPQLHSAGTTGANPGSPALSKNQSA